MNTTEKQELKMIIEECLEAKLSPIHKQLGNLDKDLNNHLKTFAGTYAKMSTDIEWIKRLLNGAGKGSDTNLSGIVNQAREDAKQDTNINWLRWAVRFIITAIVVNALSVGFIALKII